MTDTPCVKCGVSGDVSLFGYTKKGSPFKKCLKCRAKVFDESLYKCVKCGLEDSEESFGRTKRGTVYKKCGSCRVLSDERATKNRVVYTCVRCKSVGEFSLFGLKKDGNTYKLCLKCRGKVPGLVVVKA